MTDDLHIPDGVLAVVIDGLAALLDDDPVTVPDDLTGLPVTIPGWVERTVRREAAHDGCTCGPALAIRTRVVRDDPTGSRYISPLRLHRMLCPLVADGPVATITILEDSHA